MDQAPVAYRGSAKGAVLFRRWLGINLVLAIGIWTAPDAWALAVSPTAVTFQAVQGVTNSLSQTVSVSKSNNSPSFWVAIDNATWLTVSPGVGSIRRTAQVAVAVNIAGLAAGTYTATVTIHADKGGGVASVPVTLTVTPASTTSSSSTPPATSTSTTASLTWNPVMNTNLAGYKVYMGTASGQYGTTIDVGKATSYVVGNLAVGNTYYFVVTSYLINGSESLPSTEVSKSMY